MIHYSNIDNSPLFSVLRASDVSEERKDISPESEILQVAAKKVHKGLKWPRHRHLPIERKTVGTQEAWVIISGKILASFYDIDQSHFLSIELSAGDLVTVYKAGHALEVVEDDTILYEFKNGPYFGREKDKEGF